MATQSLPPVGRVMAVLCALALVLLATDGCETEKKPNPFDAINQQLANQNAEIRALRSDIHDQAQTREEIRELRGFIATLDGTGHLQLVFFVLLGVLTVLLVTYVVSVIVHLTKLSRMNYELQRMRMQMDDRNRQIVNALNSMDNNRPPPAPRPRPLPPPAFPPFGQKALKP